uniref:Uncharacterized protein n=1 Tax=Caenorhabditis japonica TaxID=281687 RepID=A0A8R1HJI6_CAEJA
MDIMFNLENTNKPPQFGVASKLRRHNSQRADHKKITLTDFAKLLCDYHEDLKVEAAQVVKQKKIAPLGLFCIKCNKDTENTTDLLNHTLDAHCPKQEKCLFSVAGIVRPHVMEMVNNAIKKQSEKTFVKKNVENCDKALSVCVTSPLATYLSISHLKIFMNAPPTSRATWQHKFVKYELTSGDTIYFAFTWVEKQMKKIKAARKQKNEKKREKELASKTHIVNLECNDLFFKNNRTEEQEKYMAKALKLPENYKTGDLQKAIFDMTCSGVHREIDETIQHSYKDTEDEDGRIMSKEERKLISTFSNKYLHTEKSRRPGALNKRYNMPNVQ